eukprot:TRINITY_DN22796_c0_g1_i1.p1 TRINITY_DN22796_c0_g1~~TRINITY_DN22796_c0_g1_i1.p1  ORF type:complete len:158 (+),score=7.20 TRINITY_DN22796_c0_g1_i1:267-740(+)
MQKHIIIIGGGIGGLSLAQGLKKAGISFSVFERDGSSVARSQGYRLRISPEGSEALEHNLTEELWDLFKATCAKKMLGMTMINAVSGEVTLHKSGPPPGREGADITRVFTADRATLRGVLMTGIESHIHYGKDFKRFTTLPNGNICVEFEDGTSGRR